MPVGVNLAHWTNTLNECGLGVYSEKPITDGRRFPNEVKNPPG